MPTSFTRPTPVTDAEIIQSARRDPVLGPLVTAAIAGLPPAYRDALTMHLWDERPLEQIALATRVRTATARLRVRRAQAYVRATLLPLGTSR